jgi:capsular exopolysaccharide synthesis family protein
MSGPANSNSQLSQRRVFINEQLDKLQTEIAKTDETISEANLKLAAANSAREIEDNQTLILALQEKKTALQANYTSLLANTEQGATNTLNIGQYAPLPTKPVGPNKPLYIILATILGLFLSVGGAYLVELLDTRVKSREEVAKLLETPILGEVPTFPRQDDGLFTAKNPRSPITDSFRSLRTNLEFLSINHPLRTILITGPDSSGGKSTIASNLALMFAKGGKKVILLDADMRRPSLHKLLGTTNDPGISDVCVGRTDLYSALRTWTNLSDQPVDSQKQFSSKENELLRILPAGTIPPNPAELLSSPRFDQVLAELKEYADLIIIDSPPIFLPDTTTLFPKVDGILMVIQSGRTSKNSILLVKEQIARSHARLLGIAINRSKVVTPFYQHYGLPAEKPVEQEKRRFNIRLPEMKASKKSNPHKASE